MSCLVVDRFIKGGVCCCCADWKSVHESERPLRSPTLLDDILADFEACGVVGERTNKLIGYLRMQGCIYHNKGYRDVWNARTKHRNWAIMEIAMKIQFYLRIEGNKSELCALGQDFTNVLEGSFIERKSTGYPLVDSRSSYWMSKKGESTFETLSDDLTSFLQMIVNLPRLNAGLAATIVVVARCHDENERPGLYLSVELIQLMGSFGASFDYDIVSNLEG